MGVALTPGYKVEMVNTMMIYFVNNYIYYKVILYLYI